MNGLFFAAVSLGLLMSLEKEKREEISLKNFFHIIKEGVEIFAASALAAVLCRWILSVLPLEKIRNGEFLILLLLPLGYELQRTQKKSWAFYITAAGFSFLAAERSRSFWDCVYFSALLAAAASLFQILLRGVRSRLALTPLPRNGEGPAFLFFLAAVIALILKAVSIFRINP